VRGMLLVTREAVPLIRASRGSIINLASILGLQGDEALVVYSATKHAVVGLSRSLAEALEPDGVRVTALCPGYVNTPMTRWVHDRIAPNAMIQPADMVEAVRFLLRLSPACRVRELVIDGPKLAGA
jgi:NAD(P)-dependent dehydrogenase (short-subunit alcohol dehydrogenase family)